ncbi:hypothetical protein TCAL_12501 [Tigriopus californicus]|uniref:RRM domain-containing protein n=1 Tax=Tigriopus californicus TaxID=6832 RepID=A0A553NBJ4_TIGCA|nr:TAR DNA-binding protein 43-like [Tigriopus californicus]TRY62811.1 hypothetical protein TCAL_12501 [Tigriopus californicus]
MTAAAAWVKIVENEGQSEDDEPMEIQTEPDGTLLLSSIITQFPGTIGLKFKNQETGGFRGVRCKEGVLQPPNPDGWGIITYICTKPKKSDDEPAAKRLKTSEVAAESKAENKKSDETSDLIVLGLPFSMDVTEVREFFEKFGPLSLCSVKRNKDGSSKGYGFMRYKDMESQKKSMLTRHMMQGRWVDVKIPDSQDKKVGADEGGIYKVFVARIDDSLSKQDLEDHFKQFGEITDIFWPRPFRGFAFVTFLESRVAQSLLNKDHVIKGVSVHIGMPVNRKKMDAPEARSSWSDGNASSSWGGYSRGGGGGGGYGGGYGGSGSFPVGDGGAGGRV